MNFRNPFDQTSDYHGRLNQGTQIVKTVITQVYNHSGLLLFHLSF